MYLVKNNYGDVYRSECYDWALQNAHIHEKMKDSLAFKDTAISYDEAYRNFVEDLKRWEPATFSADTEEYINGDGFEHPGAFIARVEALEALKYDILGSQDEYDVVDKAFEKILERYGVEISDNNDEPLFNANARPEVWKALSDVMNKINQAIEEAKQEESEKEM